MSDRYFAWLEAMSRQEQTFLAVALGGVALGLAWCLRSFIWLPEPVRKWAEPAYLVGGVGLWLGTIVFTVMSL